jgi:hypothetical protein
MNQRILLAVIDAQASYLLTAEARNLGISMEGGSRAFWC